MKALKLGQLAAFILIVASAIFPASRAFSQSKIDGTVPGLPDFLPIGSRERLLEFIATNTTSTMMTRLFYTNLEGRATSLGFSTPTDSLKFDSYTAFLHLAHTNAWRVYNACWTNMSPNSGINLRVILDTKDYYSWFVLLTNAGFVGRFTPEVLWNHPIDMSYCSIYVPDLRLYRVVVENPGGTNFTYTHQWTPTKWTPMQDGFPQDMTNTNLVVLTRWYSVGDYRARFTITSGTNTLSYTQDGDKLVPMPLRIGHDVVEVMIPTGSDAVVEQSADLTSWTPMTYSTWRFKTNRICLPVYPGVNQFFRSSYR